MSSNNSFNPITLTPPPLADDWWNKDAEYAPASSGASSSSSSSSSSTMGPGPTVDDEETAEPLASTDVYIAEIGEILSDLTVTQKMMGHIFGDSFSSNTWLQGANSFDSVETLYTLLHAKDKNGTFLCPLADFDKLREQIKKLHEINQLKKVWKTQEDLSTIGAKIKEDLVENGSVLIPGGWRDHFGGHALLYHIITQPNGLYRFDIYNTGAGCEYHNKKFKSSAKIYPVFTLQDIPKVELDTAAFFECLLEFQFLIPIDVQDAYKASDIYGYVTNMLSGKVVDYSEMPIDRYVNMQASGTCSWKVLMAFLSVNSNIRTINNFKFHMKRTYLALAYHQFETLWSKHDSVGHRSSIIRLFEASLKKYSSSLEQYFHRGMVSIENYRSAISLVKHFQKKLKVAEDTVKKLPEPALPFGGGTVFGHPDPANRASLLEHSRQLIVLEETRYNKPVSLITAKGAAIPIQQIFKVSIRSSHKTLLNVLQTYAESITRYHQLGRKDLIEEFLPKMISSLPLLLRSSTYVIQNLSLTDYTQVWETLLKKNHTAVANSILTLIEFYRKTTHSQSPSGLLMRYFLFIILETAHRCEFTPKKQSDWYTLIPKEAVSSLDHLSEIAFFDPMVAHHIPSIKNYIRSHKAQCLNLEQATERAPYRISFKHTGFYASERNFVETYCPEDKKAEAGLTDRNADDLVNYVRDFLFSNLLPPIQYQWVSGFFMALCDHRKMDLQSSCKLSRGTHSEDEVEVGFLKNNPTSKLEQELRKVYLASYTLPLCKHFASSLFDNQQPHDDKHVFTKTEIDEILTIYNLKNMRCIETLSFFEKNFHLLLQPEGRHVFKRLLFGNDAFYNEVKEGNSQLVIDRLRSLMRILIDTTMHNRSGETFLFTHNIVTTASGIKARTGAEGADLTTLFTLPLIKEIASSCESSAKSLLLRLLFDKLLVQEKSTQWVAELLSCLFEAGKNPNSQLAYNYIRCHIEKKKEDLKTLFNTLEGSEKNTLVRKLLTINGTKVPEEARWNGEFPIYHTTSHQINLLQGIVGYNKNVMQPLPPRLIRSPMYLAAFGHQDSELFAHTETHSIHTESNTIVRRYSQNDAVILSVSSKTLEKKIASMGIDILPEDSVSADRYLYLDSKSHDPKIKVIFAAIQDVKLSYLLNKRYEWWLGKNSENPHIILLDTKESRAMKVQLTAEGVTVMDFETEWHLVKTPSVSDAKWLEPFLKMEHKHFIFFWEDADQQLVGVELPRYKLSFAVDDLDETENGWGLYCDQHPGFYIDPVRPRYSYDINYAIVLYNDAQQQKLLLPLCETRILQQKPTPYRAVPSAIISADIHIEYPFATFINERPNPALPLRGFQGNRADMIKLAQTLLMAHHYAEAKYYLSKCYQNHRSSQLEYERLENLIFGKVYNNGHPNHHAIISYAIYLILESSHLSTDQSRQDMIKKIAPLYIKYIGKFHQISHSLMLESTEELRIHHHILCSRLPPCDTITYHTRAIMEKLKGSSYEVIWTDKQQPVPTAIPEFIPCSSKTIEKKLTALLSDTIFTEFFNPRDITAARRFKIPTKEVFYSLLIGYLHAKVNNDKELITVIKNAITHQMSTCNIRNKQSGITQGMKTYNVRDNQRLSFLYFSIDHAIIQLSEEQKRALLLDTPEAYFSNPSKWKPFFNKIITDSARRYYNFKAREKSAVSRTQTVKFDLASSQILPISYVPIPGQPQLFERTVDIENQSMIRHSAIIDATIRLSGEGTFQSSEGKVLTSPFQSLYRKYFAQVDEIPTPQEFPLETVLSAWKENGNQRNSLLAFKKLQRLRTEYAHVCHTSKSLQRTGRSIEDLQVDVEKISKKHRDQARRLKSSIERHLNRSPIEITVSSGRATQIEQLKHMSALASGKRTYIDIEMAVDWIVHGKIKEPNLKLHISRYILCSLFANIADRISDECEACEECDDDTIFGKLTQREERIAALLKTSHPKFNKHTLAFEYKSGKILRPKQNQLMSALSKSSKQIFQLGCGEGKTTVISPLIASMFPQVINIVPSSNYETNDDDLKRVLSETSSKIVKRFHFSRKSDQSTTRLLNKYMELCGSRQSKKNVTIVEPQSIQSLLLKYLEKLHQLSTTQHTSLPEKEPTDLVTLEKMIFFMSDTVAIIDEVHDVLNPMHQLNYTLSEDTVLPEYRWTLPMQTFKIMVLLNQKSDNIHKFPIGEHSKTPLSKKTYREHLHPQLVRALMEHPTWNLSTEEDKSYFFQYMTKKTQTLTAEKSEKLVTWLSSKPEKYQEQLKLLWSQVNVYLPHTLEMRCFVNYGPSKTIEEAIPYINNMIPAERSTFQNFDTMVDLTYQLYLHTGLKDDQLSSLIVKWQSEHSKEIHDRPAAKKMLPTIVETKFHSKMPTRPLHTINVSDPETLTQLKATFSKDPETVFEYLENHLFPAIRLKKYSLNSNAHDIANLMFKKAIAFSGTPSNYLTFPVTMLCHFDNEANGLAFKQLIENSSFTIVDEFDFEAFFGEPDTPSMLLDPHAYFEGIPNVAIAQKILDSTGDETEEILYFDQKTNKLVTLDRSGKVAPFNKSRDNPLTRITYCDQKHCTGTDTVQPCESTGILLVNKGLTFTELVQAAKRLRGLGKGQSIELVVPGIVALDIQEVTGSDVSPESIVLWATLNESVEQDKQLLHSLIQQTRNLYRRRAIAMLIHCKADTKENLIKKIELFKKYQALFIEEIDYYEYQRLASLEEPKTPIQIFLEKDGAYFDKYADCLTDEDKQEHILILKRAQELLDVGSPVSCDANLNVTAQKEQEAQQEAQVCTENPTIGFEEVYWKPVKTINRQSFQKNIVSATLSSLQKIQHPITIAVPEINSKCHLESLRLLFPEVNFSANLFVTQNFLKRAVIPYDPHLSDTNPFKKLHSQRILPLEPTEKDLIIFKRYFPQVKYLLRLESSRLSEAEPKFIAVSCHEADQIREWFQSTSLSNPRSNTLLMTIQGDVLSASHSRDVSSQVSSFAQFMFLNGNTHYPTDVEVALEDWVQEGEGAPVKERFFREMRQLRVGSQSGIIGSPIDQLFRQGQRRIEDKRTRSELSSSSVRASCSSSSSAASSSSSSSGKRTRR